MRDAALTLDVLAGFTMEDPETMAGVGHVPKNGYAAGLDAGALQGQHLGLYGPGGRDQPLSGEVETLYRRAMGELEDGGATLVADPFRASDLAEVGRPVQGLGHFDGRGMKSAPHDTHEYLKRVGPHVALRNFADFAAVMQRDRLDALVFPQMRSTLPPLHGGEPIHGTTVCEINIAGLPDVTVPAGYHASGAPFGLVFVGPLWSEATLLALTCSYEQATRHRRAPTLIQG